MPALQTRPARRRATPAPILTPRVSPHGRLLALSTMKDEAPFLLEWLAHHLAVGFTEILVYTNDCSDGTDLILQRLEALGTGIHHRDNPLSPGMKPQPSMLKRAQDEPLVREADWLLNLDADEFLCINHPAGTLDGLIDALNAVGSQAMVITWRIFGSNGIIDWSRAPVTDQYTRAAPPLWNKGWGTKTLLRHDPKHLRLGIHRPIIKSQHKETEYPDSLLWVNGSGRPLEDWFKFRGWRSIRRTVGFDWAQINHYAVKSVESYALRKFRGNTNLKKDKYNADYWSLQDRNEVEDTRIARHRAERARIMDLLLQDPEVRRLHEAALARAEARLADFRGSPEFAQMVEQLVVASRVDIKDVVAKPPKARDPAAIAATQSKIEARRATQPKPARRTAPESDSHLMAGLGAGPAVTAASIDGLPVHANHAVRVPADPTIFSVLGSETVAAGRLERRHARNIAGLVKGAARLLDAGTGFGFIAMQARLTVAGLSVLVQDDRARLVAFGRAVWDLNRPDAPDDGTVRFSDLPLQPGDGTPAGLAALIADFTPDALRLSPTALPPGMLALCDLSGVDRVILPLTDDAATEPLRAAFGPVLAAAGLVEDAEAAASGSLVFRRG